MGWRCSCCVNWMRRIELNSENECNSMMKWQIGLRLFSFMMFNFSQPFEISIWTTQSLSIRFRLWKWCKYITHKLRVSITIFFFLFGFARVWEFILFKRTQQRTNQNWWKRTRLYFVCVHNKRQSAWRKENLLGRKGVACISIENRRRYQHQMLVTPEVWFLDTNCTHTTHSYWHTNTDTCIHHIGYMEWSEDWVLLHICICASYLPKQAERFLDDKISNLHSYMKQTERHSYTNTAADKAQIGNFNGSWAVDYQYKGTKNWVFEMWSIHSSSSSSTDSTQKRANDALTLSPKRAERGGQEDTHNTTDTKTNNFDELIRVYSNSSRNGSNGSNDDNGTNDRSSVLSVCVCIDARVASVKSLSTESKANGSVCVCQYVLRTIRVATNRHQNGCKYV